jgi:cell division protein FtsB
VVSLKASNENLNSKNKALEQEIERLKADVNTLQNTVVQKPVILEKTEN